MAPQRPGTKAEAGVGLTAGRDQSRSPVGRHTPAAQRQASLQAYALAVGAELQPESEREALVMSDTAIVKRAS